MSEIPVDLHEHIRLPLAYRLCKGAYAKPVEPVPYETRNMGAIIICVGRKGGGGRCILMGQVGYLGG